MECRVRACLHRLCRAADNALHSCIMLELFTKKPIFQGNDEIHQLDVMYRILGTPTPERWPGVNSLPWYELVKPKDVIPNHFKELFQK